MKLADVKQGNIRFKMLYHELKNSRAQQLVAEEVHKIFNESDRSLHTYVHDTINLYY